MILKIVGVCIVCAVMCVILRQAGRGEMAMVLALSCSAYVLFSIFGAVEKIISEVTLIADETGLDGGIFGTVLKITGISYLTQNGADLCRDSGESALSDKIELGGKIMICLVALPSVKALFEVIADLL